MAAKSYGCTKGAPDRLRRISFGMLSLAGAMLVACRDLATDPSAHDMKKVGAMVGAAALIGGLMLLERSRHTYRAEISGQGLRFCDAHAFQSRLFWELCLPWERVEEIWYYRKAYPGRAPKVSGQIREEVWIYMVLSRETVHVNSSQEDMWFDDDFPQFWREVQTEAASRGIPVHREEFADLSPYDPAIRLPICSMRDVAARKTHLV